MDNLLSRPYALLAKIGNGVDESERVPFLRRITQQPRLAPHLPAKAWSARIGNPQTHELHSALLLARPMTTGLVETVLARGSRHRVQSNMVELPGVQHESCERRT